MQYRDKFKNRYLNVKPRNFHYFTTSEKYYDLKEQFTIN